MKKLLIMLLAITSLTAYSQKKLEVGMSYVHHIKEFKVLSDGFSITLDGKKGSKWAAKRKNAKLVALELIKRYKRQGGKKKIIVKNLIVEIQVHAWFHSKGLMVERAKEINCSWEDITKKYTTKQISKRLHSKYRKIVKRKIAIKDIEKIIT